MCNPESNDATHGPQRLRHTTIAMLVGTLLATLFAYRYDVAILLPLNRVRLAEWDNPNNGYQAAYTVLTRGETAFEKDRELTAFSIGKEDLCLWKRNPDYCVATFYDKQSNSSYVMLLRRRGQEWHAIKSWHVSEG